MLLKGAILEIRVNYTRTVKKQIEKCGINLPYKILELISR